MFHKKRAGNYTEDELHRLVRLVQKYGQVIESKETDKIMWSQKSAAWELLATNFNASAAIGSSIRTADQLKNRFMCLKTAERKAVGNRRNTLFKTGGGPYKPPKPTSTLGDAVQELISLSAKGLRNSMDSDAARDGLSDTSGDSDVDGDLQPSDIQLDILDEGRKTCEDNSMLSVAEVRELLPSCTWDSYTPAMLREPLHQALLPKIGEAENIQTGRPGSSKSAGKQPKSISITPSVKNKSPNNGNSSSMPQDTPWAGRRRPAYQRSLIERSASSTTFRGLAASKMELAELQKEHASSEEARKIEKHELEMCLLHLAVAEAKRKAEEQELNMEILKMELEFKKRK